MIRTSGAGTGGAEHSKGPIWVPWLSDPQANRIAQNHEIHPYYGAVARMQ
jgi:hypothetical protein